MERLTKLTEFLVKALREALVSCLTGILPLSLTSLTRGGEGVMFCFLTAFIYPFSAPCSNTLETAGVTQTIGYTNR